MAAHTTRDEKSESLLIRDAASRGDRREFAMPTPDHSDAAVRICPQGKCLYAWLQEPDVCGVTARIASKGQPTLRPALRGCCATRYVADMSRFPAITCCRRLLIESWSRGCFDRTANGACPLR